MSSSGSTTGMNDILVQANKALSTSSTLGVIAVAPVSTDDLLSRYGEDGVEELFEEVESVLRPRIRAVDLITSFDKYVLGVVSVDRNPKGPKFFGEKIAKILEEAEFSRMGLPVEASFVVGAAWGIPHSPEDVRGLIEKAKNNLEKAREQGVNFLAET